MKSLYIQLFVLLRMAHNAFCFPDVLTASVSTMGHTGLCQQSPQGNTATEMEVYGYWIDSRNHDPYPDGRGIMVHPIAGSLTFGGAALLESSPDPSIFNSTATAQYVTYRGYFWVAFVFRRVSPYASTSNCELTNVIYESIATGATQQLPTNIALSGYPLIFSGSYTKINTPNTIQIVSSGYASYSTYKVSRTSGTIGTRTIFKQLLTNSDWADPKLRRGLRFGFSQGITDFNFNFDKFSGYDNSNNYMAAVSINNTFIDRDLMVYSRRDNYDALGIKIYPGTVVKRTNTNTGQNPGFMHVIHVYGATKLLTTAGARVAFTHSASVSSEASLTFNVNGDVVLFNDGAGVLQIQFENVSWQFYGTSGTNPYLATGEQVLQIGSIPTNMVTKYLKVMIFTSAQYTGNGGTQPDNCDGYGWMWATAISDLSPTSPQATVKRMEAYSRFSFSIATANYTNKYLDSLSMGISLTYKNCVPPSEDYNVTIFSSSYFSGFPDWEDLVSGFTYNPAYNDVLYRQMPPIFTLATDKKVFSYAPSTTPSVPNCALTYETNNCALCNTGYYPDLSGYRELSYLITCRDKTACQGLANNGFVYVNNYEGTAYASRGMCLACPPNCKSCDSSLNRIECYFPAFQNTADLRCACNVAGCKVCNTTSCDACQPYYYVTYDNRTNVRQCASTCRSYFGLDPTYTYGTLTGYQSYMCVRCKDQNCLNCASDYRTCTSSCAAGTYLLDYNFALVPNNATTIACIANTAQVAGYVYDPVTTYFTLCASQNCTKCYATNLTDCDKCVTNNVYLVDHQRCTALAACPNGTYPQAGSTLRCWDCIADCTYCIDGSHDCIKCASGMIYHEDSKTCILTTMCTAAQRRTPTPMVKSGVTVSVCVDCMVNCDTCSSKTICTQCSPSYYFMTDTNPMLNKCKLCGRSCSLCTSSSDCQQCDLVTNIFHEDQNNCIPSTSCGAGTGSFSSSGVCRNCAANCASCNSSSTCQQCVGVFYLSQDGSNCATSCPAGEDPIPGTYLCGGCVPGCSTCTPNGTFCLSCNNGLYFKDDNSCTDCLQPGYALSGTVCKPCEDDNCTHCPSDIRICTQCKPSHLLTASKCRPCPAPMFLDIDSKCLPCLIEHCGQCANTSGTCMECQGGYYLEGRRCMLAVFRVSSTSFDKKTSTIKITFEHRLFADDYQSLVKLNLEDAESNKLDVKLESVQVKDGKLVLKISSTASFSGGLAEVTFTSPFRYFSADKSGYSLANDSASVQVTRISMNYPQETSAQYLANVVGAPGVSLLTILMFFIAKNYAIMLIKIYQMMEFMQMYNVLYPQNFRAFISVFQASNPFDFIPDLLESLHSDKNCPLLSQKMIDEGIGCHFISNANPSIMFVCCWMVLALLFKIASALLSPKKQSNGSNQPKYRFSMVVSTNDDPKHNDNRETGLRKVESRLPLKVRLRNWVLMTNDTLSSMKAVFLLMQLLDMDIILAMAINIKYYPGDKDRSLANIVNIILSGTVFIGFPILIGVIFARTKSALKDPKGPNSYLLEERTTTNFFTVYHEVLMMCRNYVGCILTIWLYDKPTLQMITLSVLLGTFGVFQFKYRVLVSKFGSNAMGLLSTLYSVSSLVLLISKILESHLSRSQNLLVIGYTVILLFVCIISVNFGPSFYEIYKLVKNKCKRSKKQTQHNTPEDNADYTKPQESHRIFSDELSSVGSNNTKLQSNFDVNIKKEGSSKLMVPTNRLLTTTYLKNLSRNEPSIGGFSDITLKPVQASTLLTTRQNAGPRSLTPSRRSEIKSPFAWKTLADVDKKPGFTSSSKLYKHAL